MNFPDIYVGDDVIWDLTFTDSDGTAQDISGSSIRFVVKANKDTPDASAVIDKTLVVSSPPDPTAGLAQFTITDTETSGITPGSYVGEMIYISAAELKTTIASAKVRIIQTVRD
jgi:hypothetical protein